MITVMVNGRQVSHYLPHEGDELCEAVMKVGFAHMLRSFAVLLDGKKVTPEEAKRITVREGQVIKLISGSVLR